MKEKENSKIGLIGTISFHALLCVFLYFSTFKVPNPLPEEEGILVDFGDLNNGMQQQKKQQGRKAPKQIVQANITIDKKNISSKDISDAAKKKLLTQDTEEAPSIVDAKEKSLKDKLKDQATKKWLEKLEKNKKLEEDKKADKLNKEKEEELKHKLKKDLEAKLKRKEEKAREIIEEDRIRKIEIEKKKKEEKIIEEKRRLEDIKKKEEEIDNKVKNAFTKKPTPDNKNTKTEGTSNLKGFPSGIKGNPNGQGSNNSSIGSGLGSKGISFSLKGRKSSIVPKPTYNLQESGRVVVEITVNKQGVVTNARAGMPGSTTTSPQLFQAAKNAALKAKFNADPDAPEFQTGRISYTFFLN